MKKTDELKTLLDEYCVPGFRTLARVKQDEKDPAGFALTLVRRQKKRYAVAAERFTAVSMIDGRDACEILIAGNVPSTSILNSGVLTVSGAA